MMRPPRTWPNFPFPVFCISCVAWERRHPCVCVRPGRTNPQPRPCVHIRMGIHVPTPQAAHLVHACACGVLAHGHGVGTWIPLCVCASRTHGFACCPHIHDTVWHLSQRESYTLSTVDDLVRFVQHMTIDNIVVVEIGHKDSLHCF